MLRLGHTTKDRKPVELTLDEQRQGTYIIGTTGTGKSTLLKNIIYQDLHQDRTHGLCLLDPHGDLVDEILGLVPPDRIEDVILFNPMDLDHPFGLNLLECDHDDPHQVRWMVSTVMGTLERLAMYSWGPRLEHVLRTALLTAMEIPNSTFIELLLLLTSKEYRDQVIKRLDDKILKEFWTELPTREKELFEVVGSTVNKISPFITDKSMRNIVGQTKSTVNIKDVMNKGQILLINLSKGDLGEANSALLGSVLVNQIMIAAFQRRPIPAKERRPFHLIVDEFQDFATESFAILQSEARKYAVDVVVAHQFRDQLDELSKGSTLNVGNMVVFRISGRDSYALASQFDNTPSPADTRVEPVYQSYEFKGQEFLIEASMNTGEGKLYQEVELPRRPYSDVEAEMANQLSILPNYQAWCRLINIPTDHVKLPRLVEHKIVTEELGKGEWNQAVSDAIRKRSSEMARTKKQVEDEIEERMQNPFPGDEEPPVAAAQKK